MIAPKLIPLRTDATLAILTALGVALAARGVRALTWSGVAAATVVGMIAVMAGWGWGILLILYFVLSAALSHMGATARSARTERVVEKGGARDAVQVLANGGIFALLALAFLHTPSPLWHWGALGALAASAADTWATELGTRFGGIPRSIISRTIVHPGMSGGVTWTGTAGGIAGAVVVALLGWSTGWTGRAALAGAAAGVVGMLADSVAGATIQGSRWCDSCKTVTERSIHHCGSPTRHHDGIAWISNDAVNVMATVVGATVAILAAWLAV